MKKPIILVFTGHYLPGYKSGGILRTLINTIDYLHLYFDFKIITRDRDLGDDKPYKDLEKNQWIRVNNVDVYYISSDRFNILNVSYIIKNTNFDLVYLTSFFDKLSVFYLLIRRFNYQFNIPVVLAPFGEFASASFTQKKVKKLIFLFFSKLFNLYKKVLFRVSSNIEKEDLLKFLNVKNDLIRVVHELPRKSEIDSVRHFDFSPALFPLKDHLKIIFLSRISREKNLDYAISVLRSVHRQISFDIFGPIENQDYWDECKKALQELPSNISFSYCGTVHSDQVANIFSQYDLFLFPTGGEAFGNVIAESLLAGTPVLISDQTPWKNLEESGFGWDLPLSNIQRFSQRIDNFHLNDDLTRVSNRVIISQKVKALLFNDEILNSNVKLFSSAIDSQLSLNDF